MWVDYRWTSTLEIRISQLTSSLQNRHVLVLFSVRRAPSFTSLTMNTHSCHDFIKSYLRPWNFMVFDARQEASDDHRVLGVMVVEGCPDLMIGMR